MFDDLDAFLNGPDPLDDFLDRGPAPGFTLHEGDCLEVIPTLRSGSVGLVLADPPYGTTSCKWDEVIPLEQMWQALAPVVTPRAALVFTASQPFTSAMVMSRPKAFAHAWVWNKNVGANFAQAKRQPLKVHEDVVVFGMAGKQPAYYPEMTARDKPMVEGGRKPQRADATIPIRGKFTDLDAPRRVFTESYPVSILNFPARADPERGLHPTQKPVALMEYLVRTYSNPGDTVLDFTMGSGTTGVACARAGRNFIGIEKDPEYFQIAKARIAEAYRV